MSSRSIRRAAERKAKKQQLKEQRKQERLAALHTPHPELPLEEEFSPEFMAEANSVRARVAQRLASFQPAVPSTPEIGFVSQKAPQPEKSCSSLNALKHGLASGQILMPGEDLTEFQSLLNGLLEEHHPHSDTEQLLVCQMAQSWWLAQRALRLQNDCFTADGVNEKQLALFLRYQTTHQRAFDRALNTLIRLQKERVKAINRLVSQRKHNGDEPAGLSEAKTQEMVFVSQNEPQTNQFVELDAVTQADKPGHVDGFEQRAGFVAAEGRFSRDRL